MQILIVVPGGGWNCSEEILTLFLTQGVTNLTTPLPCRAS